MTFDKDLSLTYKNKRPTELHNGSCIAVLGLVAIEIILHCDVKLRLNRRENALHIRRLAPPLLSVSRLAQKGLQDFFNWSDAYTSKYYHYIASASADG